MKRLTCLFMLFLLVGVGRAATAWVEPKEEVASATEQWATNFSAENPDPILALYDEDAVLLGAVSPTLREDPGAIRDYFVNTFARFPQRKVTFKNQSIRVYGNTAVNTGYWTFSGVSLKGKTITVRVRYIFTYVMRNGKWMIVGHHSSIVPERRSPAGASKSSQKYCQSTSPWTTGVGPPPALVVRVGNE